LMFVDDLALTEESELEVMGVFEEGKAAKESKGLQANKSQDTESNQEDGHVVDREKSLQVRPILKGKTWTLNENDDDEMLLFVESLN